MKNIAIQDFYENAEFTVGRICQAECLRGEKKLIKLRVDCGEKENRIIITNLGERFPPDKLLNVHTIFITNFPSVIIKGIKSDGMLFYGKTPDGMPFVINLGQHTPIGSKIG